MTVGRPNEPTRWGSGVIYTPMHFAGRRVGALSVMRRTTDYLEENRDGAGRAAVFAAHADIALTGARRLQHADAAL